MTPTAITDTEPWPEDRPPHALKHSSYPLNPVEDVVVERVVRNHLQIM